MSIAKLQALALDKKTATKVVRMLRKAAEPNS
jgi:hypothetical protein